MKLHEWKLTHRRCLALLLTLALTGAASSLFLPRLLAQGRVDSLDCICAAVFLAVTVAGSFNFLESFIG